MIRLILLVALLVTGTVSTAQITPEDHAKPIVFVFQKQKDPASIKEEADKVAAFLSKELGRAVTPVVPTEYAASVQALISKRADFAYISAIPFLLARRDGQASLLLAELRPDLTSTPRTRYDSVFVTTKDAPLTSLPQLVTNASTLRIAFTSTTSTSGYVIPYRALLNAGLAAPDRDIRRAFRTASFAGSYTAALEQVATGRADVACVSAYTIEGPTADTYLPEADRAKLRVLARVPDVPTHLIAAGGHVDEPTRKSMKNALLKLATEQPDLLRRVYGAVALTETDENEHVRPVVEALESLGQPIEQFAR